jgi:putative phage-type endonuclease
MTLYLDTSSTNASARHVWYRDSITLDSILYRGGRLSEVAQQCGGAQAFCAYEAADNLSLRSRKLAAYRQTLQGLLRDRGVQQRTPSWCQARRCMITASDAAQALGRGKFGTQRDFYEKKLERVTVDYNIPPILWGVKYEPAVCRVYEHLFGVAVHEFGLLRHPDHQFIGASPDGINDHGIMLEIKCPWRMRIDGTVPEQYYLQMQLQLDVCGLDECDYLECEFREILEDEEFLQASGEWLAGGVLTDDTTGHNTYRFCFGNTDSMSPQELLDWFGRNPDKRRTLFVLCKHNVMRVTRDKEFLRHNIEHLRAVWLRLQEYVQDPSKLPPKEPVKKRMVACMFVDSDDEAESLEKTT